SKRSRPHRPLGRQSAGVTFSTSALAREPLTDGGNASTSALTRASLDTGAGFDLCSARRSPTHETTPRLPRWRGLRSAPKRRLDIRSLTDRLDDSTSALARRSFTDEPTTRLPQRDVLDFRARAGFAHLRSQRPAPAATPSRAPVLDSCSAARPPDLPAANRLDCRASSGSAHRRTQRLDFRARATFSTSALARALLGDEPGDARAGF